MDSKEALADLLSSPGWQIFIAHVEQEWGTVEKGGGTRFTLAARAAANDVDDNSAIVKMRQVCFAQREVHNLLAWVHHELKQAKKENQEFAAAGTPDFSRRGGL